MNNVLSCPRLYEWTKMTNSQLIEYLRGEGFTASEFFFIVAHELPFHIDRLSVKKLKPMIPIWKDGFKTMNKWRSILDEQQRRQNEEGS